MPRVVDRKVIKGIIYKRCPHCRIFHPESEYNRCEAAPDHLQGYCRLCNSAYCSDWRREKMGELARKEKQERG